MLLQPGGTYRLHLSLSGARGIGPAWIVGAVGATFPLAELVSIEQYTSEYASVLIRWRRRPATINNGQVLTAVAEGIQVPGAPMPTATVTDVQMVSMDLSAPAFHGTAKFVAAIALIGVTALLIDRIS